MNRRQLLKSLPAIGAASAFDVRAAGESAAKSRMRPALCAYSYRDALAKKTMTYQDLVRRAVDFDADGLDTTVYWFPDTSDEFLLPLKNVAYRNGIAIYSIAVRTEMTQSTPEGREKELADMRKWVDVATKLGAVHMRVFGGRVPNGVTVDQAAGWVIDTLKSAAEYAGSKGIILGLENHGGVTEKAETVVKVVKAVNSPWVGINLDTGNFNLDRRSPGRDPYEQIQECIPYAVNFQLKTDIRMPDGTSQPSDWDRILKMAAQAGYKGYLALEYEAKEPAETAVPRLMAKLRTLTNKYGA